MFYKRSKLILCLLYTLYAVYLLVWTVDVFGQERDTILLGKIIDNGVVTTTESVVEIGVTKTPLLFRQVGRIVGSRIVGLRFDASKRRLMICWRMPTEVKRGDRKVLEYTDSDKVWWEIFDAKFLKKEVVPINPAKVEEIPVPGGD